MTEEFPLLGYPGEVNYPDNPGKHLAYYACMPRYHFLIIAYYFNDKWRVNSRFAPDSRIGTIQTCASLEKSYDADNLLQAVAIVHHLATTGGNDEEA